MAGRPSMMIGGGSVVRVRSASGQEWQCVVPPNCMSIILADSDGTAVSLPISHEALGRGDLPMHDVLGRLLRLRDKARSGLRRMGDSELVVVPRSLVDPMKLEAWEMGGFEPGTPA